ncbi:PaaI family thioesterase [Nocardioides sp. R-C-SC26]|uniref:PaaI family thioesterase n=1 Tax=Nocardioides sp. R-C-SC26 TaxID=2870414 RepID=UPI001E51ED26|nr:PaaI family thioesterase [Nocardioides sp. R-C-SC26]
MSSLAQSFEFVDLPDAYFDEIETRFAPLTAQARRLVDLTIRSEADEADVAEAAELLRRANDLLERRTRPFAAGVRFNASGRAANWGNAAVGLRNAIAPPMQTRHGDDGVVRASLHLGAAYEGPPRHVHGGVSALLLDHLMGETASQFKRFTATGTLTLRYVAPLPLGPVELEGRIVSEEGRKIRVHASIAGGAGVAVEADGLFIVPRDAA